MQPLLESLDFKTAIDVYFVGGHVSQNFWDKGIFGGSKDHLGVRGKQQIWGAAAPSPWWLRA